MRNSGQQLLGSTRLAVNDRSPLGRNWRPLLAAWSALCTTVALLVIDSTRRAFLFSDSMAYWDPRASFSTMIDPFGSGRRSGLLTAAIMRFAGTSDGAVLLQVLFACVCWSSLCAVVALSASSPRRSIVPLAAVFLVATSPLVSSWNVDAR